MSSSSIVTWTEAGLPSVTADGRVPSDTVKVSSRVSVSWFVAIVPVPVFCSAAMVIEASVPTSPASAVFEPDVSIVTGIVTSLEIGLDSVAVTVTPKPSTTGSGDADSDTFGMLLSVIVTWTEVVPVAR